jgi:hypothetical protein
MAIDTVNDTDNTCKGMRYCFTTGEILALEAYFNATCELVLLAREVTKKMAKRDEFSLEETKEVLMIIQQIIGIYNNYNYQFDRLSDFVKTVKASVVEIITQRYP